MSKSPWGNIGAWAAEAERAEEEERQQEAAAAAAAAAAPAGSFPSLKEAVNTKQKKKTSKMSLQEFTMQSSFGSSGGRGLTPDEMLRLPTAPKERSADEMQYGRLGGGFSSYGTRTSGPPPGRNRDRDFDGEGSYGSTGRRSYGGFVEDDRRRGPPPRVSDFDQPSRADEVDNWGSMKKSLPSVDSGPGRPNRYGSLGGSGGFSRADDDNNWAASKKPVAMAPPPARSSNFGSGFREPRAEPDRWTRDGGYDRQRLVLEGAKSEEGTEVTVKVNKPNPFGEARPREEVLAEKGLDWKKLDMEIEGKKVVSRPTSSHSSRPESSQSNRSEGGPTLQAMAGEAGGKPKSKVNPFGDAKPREVLLEQKGLDWRKIDMDLEHRRVERPETEEEKNLKEEIETLKKESLQRPGDDNIQTAVLQKERDLELLTRELDDKIRFGQKAIERPSSGAGRIAVLHDRAPSQPAGYEEPRVADMERPRSRGTGETWSRPSDDRRAYQGGRERGFFSGREMDRSRSRDRW